MKPKIHLFLKRMNTKILVSGATGLLGAHVLVELAKSDQQILALYRSEETKDEVEKVFSYYKMEDKWSSIEWRRGEVSDVQFLQDVMSDITQVYHCAAMVSFDPKDAVQLHYVNVEGTKNMVNAALYNKVNKFLHVSSTATIGSPVNGEACTEEHQWNNDDYHTYYAKSKYSSEREVWRGIEEGLNSVIINPCVILGPGDPQKSSGTIFSTMANGLKFYTQGGNAFVDVRDVARVMVLLMNSQINSERFLCIGENLRFKELFTQVANSMGLKPPAYRASRVMTSIAWRLMSVFSFITNKRAKITSESARASHKNVLFSNQKIKDYLDIEFTPIPLAIQNTVDYLNFTQKLK
jgi:nucleoside-diphosphate-sugar epimerase